MKPKDEDVQAMVLALFTLMNGIQRATRNNPAAGRLSMLQLVAARPGIHPSEIAVELGVNQSSVTRQVQALEDEDHLTVTADPQDARACIIKLTRSGREMLSSLNKIGLGRFASFVAGWDAREVRTLTRLLVKLEESKAEVARREAQPVRRRWKQKKTQ